MRVLILRPKELIDETVGRFRREGFEAYGCPFIEIEYLDFEVPEHDFAIVMSQNAAKQIIERGIRLRNVIAIGKKTAEVLKSHGYSVATPSKFDSKSLVEEFSGVLKGKRVVILKSNAENKELKKLSKISELKEVVIYRINPLRGEDQINTVRNLCKFDVIVFSSSIIAKTFLELCRVEDLRDKICIAIGPPTADVLRSYGIEPIVPKEYTFDGVLEVLRTLKK